MMTSSPVNDIAVFVNGSRTESLLPRKCSVYLLLEDMCRRPDRSVRCFKAYGRRMYRHFLLGLLASFSFWRLWEPFSPASIEQYIEFARQVIACLQELHVFCPLQIVQRFLAFYIRAIEAFENLFTERYANFSCPWHLGIRIYIRPPVCAVRGSHR